MIIPSLTYRGLPDLKLSSFDNGSPTLMPPSISNVKTANRLSLTKNS